MLSRYISILIAISILLPAATLCAIPLVYEPDDTGTFITSGQDILAIEYLAVRDNLTTPTGADYPDAALRIVLYKPENYEWRGLISEDVWDRRDELQSFSIPGPSADGNWANDGMVAFRSSGIYTWTDQRFDRIVFRIVVDNPSDIRATETLIWGIINETSSRSTVEFHNDSVDVNFRTLDLPEETGTPSVEIEEVWYERNIVNAGYEGINVHVRFHASDMRTLAGRIGVYVHYMNSNAPVECYVQDAAYRTSEGSLTIQQDFMPLMTETTFTDFIFFIPYAAFPESHNFIEYYTTVQILDSSWMLMASHESGSFALRNPEKND